MASAKPIILLASMFALVTTVLGMESGKGANKMTVEISSDYESYLLKDANLAETRNKKVMMRRVESRHVSKSHTGISDQHHVAGDGDVVSKAASLVGPWLADDDDDDAVKICAEIEESSPSSGDYTMIIRSSNHSELPVDTVYQLANTDQLDTQPFIVGGSPSWCGVAWNMCTGSAQNEVWGSHQKIQWIHGPNYYRGIEGTYTCTSAICDGIQKVEIDGCSVTHYERPTKNDEGSWTAPYAPMVLKSVGKTLGGTYQKYNLDHGYGGGWFYVSGMGQITFATGYVFASHLR